MSLIAKKLRVGLLVDEIHPLLDKIKQRITENGVECEFIHWSSMIHFLDIRGYSRERHLESFDVIYLDRMGEKFPSYLSQLLLLNDIGHEVQFVNRPTSYLRARDKGLALKMIGKSGLPHPRTSIVFSMDTALEVISAATRPMIAKSLQGFSAKEVCAFHSSQPPKEFLAELLRRDGSILIQEFVEDALPFIWRIDVVANRIIVANQRFSFRSSDTFKICNGTQGGDILFWKPEQVPERVRYLALKSAQAFSLDVAGVDIIESKDGKLTVLEVNPEPDITLDRFEFPYAIADLLIDKATRTGLINTMTALSSSLRCSFRSHLNYAPRFSTPCPPIYETGSRNFMNQMSSQSFLEGWKYA